MWGLSLISFHFKVPSIKQSFSCPPSPKKNHSLRGYCFYHKIIVNEPEDTLRNVKHDAVMCHITQKHLVLGTT